MARRDLLHLSKLTDFSHWLISQGWTIREPKGDYEVLRATKPGYDTLIIWSKMDAKEHLSVPDKWVSTVRKFIKSDKLSNPQGEAEDESDRN